MKIHLLVRLEEILVEREAEAQRKREEVRRERERQEQERLEEMAAVEESVDPHPNRPQHSQHPGAASSGPAGIPTAGVRAWARQRWTEAGPPGRVREPLARETGCKTDCQLSPWAPLITRFSSCLVVDTVASALSQLGK